MNKRAYAFMLAMVVATGGLALSAGPAAAQKFPERAIRLVVPYAPGGATDIVARQVGVKLGEVLGQQVLIENKPGANANLGGDNCHRGAVVGSLLGASCKVPLKWRAGLRVLQGDRELEINRAGEDGMGWSQEV